MSGDNRVLARNFSLPPAKVSWVLEGLKVKSERISAGGWKGTNYILEENPLKNEWIELHYVLITYNIQRNTSQMRFGVRFPKEPGPTEFDKCYLELLRQITPSEGWYLNGGGLSSGIFSGFDEYGNETGCDFYPESKIFQGIGELLGLWPYEPAEEQ